MEQSAVMGPTHYSIVGIFPSYKRMDVTDIVVAWHNAPKYGLEFIVPRLETVYNLTFESCKHGEMPPQLVVTYHLPPVPLITAISTTLYHGPEPQGANVHLWNNMIRGGEKL